ncbi:hypothetical protein CBE01nite_42540 [Clostridium beijerinckii]|uniref:Cell wall-binding protein n=1 Tax=Clostridium beijerinckii TaxID=1520 RepID=A0AB74VFB1_CLOBE|nr:hypothetical protein [Clostridium beijerinckii]NRZ24338.1 glucan-binding YG repeat protein [Clostridium beijerinckii]NYB99443.1 glucan-binding YG repeat protein [Clostridium beijerinckii]OOM20862.1 putative endo-beta-N-acetylglucosaminidase precursor [Clostridium beijerinckii]QUN35178.1 hypothetical protein KEC93_25310 [Clostridium beijerinckii]SQB20252.1 collagenolytic protease [Clostridium beijerinckii]
MNKSKLRKNTAIGSIILPLFLLNTIGVSAKGQENEINTMSTISIYFKGGDIENVSANVHDFYYRDDEGDAYYTGDVSKVFDPNSLTSNSIALFIGNDGKLQSRAKIDAVSYIDKDGNKIQIGDLEETSKNEVTDSTEESKVADLNSSQVGASGRWTTEGPGGLKYIDSNGSPHEGWLNFAGKTYYCNGGVPETHFLVKGDKTYLFRDSGELFKEIPTVDGVVESIFDKNEDGILDEVEIPNGASDRNAKKYIVDGSSTDAFKYFNKDGTIAKNQIIQSINSDGGESLWFVTDKYGYIARQKAKLKINGKTYIEYHTGYNENSSSVINDPDTNEEILINLDKSLGTSYHPMYIACNEWGDTGAYRWYHSDSEGRIEKSVWRQNDAKTKWYYLDEKGIMVRYKWIQIGGDWYYFDPEGAMVTNKTIDGYRLGADGKMI